MIISIARDSTSHKFSLFIVKVITEYISVIVQDINIIRIICQILEGFEEFNMFIIKLLVLRKI